MPNDPSALVLGRPALERDDRGDPQARAISPDALKIVLRPFSVGDPISSWQSQLPPVDGTIPCLRTGKYEYAGERVGE